LLVTVAPHGTSMMALSPVSGSIRAVLPRSRLSRNLPNLYRIGHLGQGVGKPGAGAKPRDHAETCPNGLRGVLVTPRRHPPVWVSLVGDKAVGNCITTVAQLV
jgi:hypothetical protein